MASRSAGALKWLLGVALSVIGALSVFALTYGDQGGSAVTNSLKSILVDYDTFTKVVLYIADPLLGSIREIFLMSFGTQVFVDPQWKHFLVLQLLYIWRSASIYAGLSFSLAGFAVAWGTLLVLLSSICCGILMGGTPTVNVLLCSVPLITYALYRIGIAAWRSLYSANQFSRLARFDVPPIVVGALIIVVLKLAESMGLPLNGADPNLLTFAIFVVLLGIYNVYLAMSHAGKHFPFMTADWRNELSSNGNWKLGYSILLVVVIPILFANVA